MPRTRSYSDYIDLPADAADESGWFTWIWPGTGAGDGEYTFTAVAVTPDKHLGESWSLTYTLDAGPPGSPTLTEVRSGDGVVMIRWLPPNPVAGDLDHYLVRRSDGAAFTSFPSLDNRSTTFVDRSVTNLSSYTYSVVAVDERGRESTPSSGMAATPAIQTDAVIPCPHPP